MSIKIDYIYNLEEFYFSAISLIWKRKADKDIDWLKKDLLINEIINVNDMN